MFDQYCFGVLGFGVVGDNMAPLICTTNTQARVDYGIPIYATQSTDYRTSTGKNHDYIAPVPQEFDAVSFQVMYRYTNNSVHKIIKIYIIFFCRLSSLLLKIQIGY